MPTTPQASRPPADRARRGLVDRTGPGASSCRPSSSTAASRQGRGQPADQAVMASSRPTSMGRSRAAVHRPCRADDRALRPRRRGARRLPRRCRRRSPRPATAPRRRAPRRHDARRQPADRRQRTPMPPRNADSASGHRQPALAQSWAERSRPAAMASRTKRCSATSRSRSMRGRPATRPWTWLRYSLPARSGLGDAQPEDDVARVPEADVAARAKVLEQTQHADHRGRPDGMRRPTRCRG